MMPWLRSVEMEHLNPWLESQIADKLSPILQTELEQLKHRSGLIKLEIEALMEILKKLIERERRANEKMIKISPKIEEFSTALESVRALQDDQMDVLQAKLNQFSNLEEETRSIHTQLSELNADSDKFGEPLKKQIHDSVIQVRLIQTQYTDSR